jgi:hypothetical protein
MARLKRTWTLPPPEETEEEYIWYPVVRVGRFIPFGYEQDPDDPDILLPIPEELELFEQAKKHLKQYSYRQVAAWLSEQSGRPISHVGLFKRVKLEQGRKRQASNLRYLAERYKAALEKAEKIERHRVGARGTPDGDGETDITCSGESREDRG